MSNDDPPSAPLRPSLPTSAWAVAAVWLGIQLAEAALWRDMAAGAHAEGLKLACGAAGLCALAGVAAMHHKRSILALLAIGLAGGLALGCLSWARWSADAGKLAEGASRRWGVEVLQDEKVGSFGTSSLVRMSEGSARGAVVELQWPEKVAPPPVGRHVVASGSFQPCSADQWGQLSHRRGTVGRLRASRVTDTGWARSVRGVLGPLRAWAVARVAEVPGVGGDLLGGVVLGDVRRLSDTDAERDFKTTGLTHLVAVSGSHLVVVAAVAGWLLGLGGLGRRIRAPATVAVLGAYVVLSGVQPSAVRAWVMASAVAVAWFGGRRVDGGSVLSAAAGLVLLVSPGSAFDLGFQLSVCAVAGLVLFARLAESWLEMLLPGLAKRLAAPIALTLAATFSTFPLITGTFGTLSLVSPVANLAVGPLMSAVLVVGLAGLGVAGVLPPAGSWLLHLAGAIGAGAASLAAWMASWPRAAIALAVAPWVAGAMCAGAGALLWAAWPRPTRRSALLAAAVAAAGISYLAIGPSVRGGASIEVCDVGQGDAILVRDGPRAVLIDTGPSESALRAVLGRQGVRTLDAVVITHLHADHDGGLRALDGLAQPNVVCVPAGAGRVLESKLPEAMALSGAGAVRELAAGDVLRVGRITLRCVWPRSAVPDPATNEASVVLRADAERFSALLTGDAENDVLEPLAGDGSIGEIDVLKVGHHGSAGAVSPSLLRTLRPEWALVSVGAGNRFGHPRASTMRELTNSAARTLRTDRAGDIEVVLGEGEYSVAADHGTEGSAGEQKGVSSGGTRHGKRNGGCATLASHTGAAREQFTRADPHQERDGEAAFRVQVGLPDLRGAGSAARVSARAAETRSGGGRGPRLQHGDVRRGVGGCGHGCLGVQHVAICERAPPRDRAGCGEDEQGCDRQAGCLPR